MSKSPHDILLPGAVQCKEIPSSHGHHKTSHLEVIWQLIRKAGNSEQVAKEVATYVRKFSVCVYHNVPSTVSVV